MGYLRDGEDLDQAFSRVKREAIGAAKAEVAAMLSTEPKVYIALLTQTGTDVPVATILKNTLNDIPIIERSETGDYSISSSAFITHVKTRVSIDERNNSPIIVTKAILEEEFEDNKILFRNYILSIDFADKLFEYSLLDINGSVMIKIEVYP